MKRQSLQAAASDDVLAVTVGDLPDVYSNHLMLINFVVFMMLAQGANVIFGFIGYLSFGYVGFFGAGAYGFSLMVMHLAAALAVLQIVSSPALQPVTNGPYGISLSGVINPTSAYATARVGLAATLLVVIWLGNSRFGMALKAIRVDPVSAAMAGIDVVRACVVAWRISGAIAGFAGGVFARSDFPAPWPQSRE